MNVGIIGAGTLGSNAARLLAKSGISATIANSRGPASLAGLIEELGPSIRAGTVGEAASADIVLVAVRWVDLGKALGGLSVRDQRPRPVIAAQRRCQRRPGLGRCPGGARRPDRRLVARLPGQHQFRQMSRTSAHRD